MKKLLALLLTACCLLAAVSAFAEIESVDPIEVENNVYISAYGFASQDRAGNTTMYGNFLDSSEAAEAKGQTPLFYVFFTNIGDSPVSLKLYIRGGAHYDGFWSKTISVGAHDSVPFVASDRKSKSLAKFAGTWSIGVNGQSGVRITLYGN